MSRACVTEPDVRGAGGSRAPQLGGRRSVWDVTRLPGPGKRAFPPEPRVRTRTRTRAFYTCD